MKSRQYFQQTKIVIISCFLTLLLLTGVQPLKAAVEVSASLNVHSFPLDRVAALSIVVKGVRSFQPQMPEVEGLQFHQRGQSTQVEIINGSYSSSVTSTFFVQASHVGTFTIPAIQIRTKDGNARTEPITFEVTASNRAAVAAQGRSSASSTARLRSGEADEVAFLRVKPAKKKSYSGEVVPVQIKVYFRDGIKANLNSLRIPFVKTAGRREKQKKTTVASLLLCLVCFSGIHEAQASKGEEAYGEGDFITASEFYDEQLQHSPDDARLNYNYGTAAYKNNMYEDAAKAFSEALKSDDLGLQEEAYYNRGNALFQRGKETGQTDPKHTLKKKEGGQQLFSVSPVAPLS